MYHTRSYYVYTHILLSYLIGILDVQDRANLCLFLPRIDSIAEHFRNIVWEVFAPQIYWLDIRRMGTVDRESAI